MKILWITNIMLPPICEAIGQNGYSVGGWMFSSLKNLRTYSDNKYAVATIYTGNKLIEKEIDGITWYLLPMRGKNTIKYNKNLESYWREIKNKFNPNVVHIHGSEYPHGLAYVNACGPEGVVVSLQGIISSYARYYAAGIDFRDVKKCLTFRDFIKRGDIRSDQKSFEHRGVLEKKLLSTVHHIIGRTDWDKAHALTINPNANYYYCGETLRDAFYKNHWEYDKCKPYSIFTSQGSYPIKGLHMLFQAMPLILREFPETKIYVGGSNPTALPWYRIGYYGKYLKKLIKELNLSDKVIFTGMLTEEKMCERYLKSNLFVCPSSIENSPNSLGEAQLLGMPYIASFVGGIPEIVEYNRDCLYRFEEVEMLAEKICSVFRKKYHQDMPFSRDRYDKGRNTKLLLSIYNLIYNNNNSISNNVNF